MLQIRVPLQYELRVNPDSHQLYLDRRQFMFDNSSAIKRRLLEIL